MHVNTPKPPYLGAAYYPETWPLEMIPEDVSLMEGAGCNLMRVGEFAWYRMEPREGEYDFSWLHAAVDKMAEKGILTVMCTPTCTPPRWLSVKHPEILQVDAEGKVFPHGSRRQYCPNNPVYRAYTEKIVTKMAEEFGDDENIIAWQIDNEFSPAGGCCNCPVCQQKFKDALRARYGTIEKLNEAWGLQIWSQCYNDFESIAIPIRKDTWNHPAFVHAWSRFMSDSYVEYCALQARVLHARVKPHQKVGTDMMPISSINYVDMHKDLDVVMFNHYNGPSNLYQCALWMDYIRNILPVPFLNTETSSCWAGGTAAGMPKAEGFCYANTMLPVVAGGNGNLYWHWRAHRTGHEIQFGGVVDSWGRYTYTINQIRRLSRSFAAAGDFLGAAAPVQADVALHFSCDAWQMFQAQNIARGFEFYEQYQTRYYRPLWESGLYLDVLEPAHGLDGYKVIVTPLQPDLAEGGLAPRLKAWIEAGGTWICGPLTDIRDEHGAKIFGKPFSVLEDWTGMYRTLETPEDENARITVGGAKHAGAHWMHGFETRGSKALATYCQGPLKGLAAITESTLGKGKIIILGTTPPPDVLGALVRSVCESAGAAPLYPRAENLYAVPRAGNGRSGVAAVELMGQEAFIDLPYPMKDLLTGERREGRVVIPAYDAFIAEKI